MVQIDYYKERMVFYLPELGPENNSENWSRKVKIECLHQKPSQKNSLHDPKSKHFEPENTESN